MDCDVFHAPLPKELDGSIGREPTFLFEQRHVGTRQEATIPVDQLLAVECREIEIPRVEGRRERIGGMGSANTDRVLVAIDECRTGPLSRSSSWAFRRRVRSRGARANQDQVLGFWRGHSGSANLSHRPVFVRRLAPRSTGDHHEYDTSWFSARHRGRRRGSMGRVTRSGRAWSRPRVARVGRRVAEEGRARLDAAQDALHP